MRMPISRVRHATAYALKPYTPRQHKNIASNPNAPNRIAPRRTIRTDIPSRCIARSVLISTSGIRGFSRRSSLPAANIRFAGSTPGATRTCSFTLSINFWPNGT